MPNFTLILWKFSSSFHFKSLHFSVEVSPTKVPYPSRYSSAIVSRAREVINFARSSLQEQQARMERLAKLRRRQVDWNVGNKVTIDPRSWKMDRPARKLPDKWCDHVKVLEKSREDSTIYPIFHSHTLRRYARNPLPDQVLAEPAPIQLLPEQTEYKVEDIVGARISNKVLQYQIKWKGFDEDLPGTPVQMPWQRLTCWKGIRRLRASVIDVGI